MTDLIIVGAGGMARETVRTINRINAVSPTWNVLGFIDDNTEKTSVDGYFGKEYKLLGTIVDWVPSGNELYVMTIANPKTKEKIVASLREKGAKFATIVSPSAAIGEGTSLGEGCILFSDAAISIDCRIGDFVFFNSLCGIGHDAVIGDFCTFGPKVCISGGTKIGKCVNVGALASTYPGIEVGDYATIGMNSAAIRRVKPNTTVIGVPAKNINK